MNLTFTITENVRGRLGRLLPRAVENVVAALAEEAKMQIKMSLTNRELKARRGTLRGSWGGAPHYQGRGMDRSATLRSTGVKYAAIHEFGGTIRPVHAQNLWIPTEALMMGSGAARGTPKQVMSNPQAFGFSGTFRRGQVVFGVRSRGKRGSGPSFKASIGGEMSTITPIFHLSKLVNIPARRYISKSLARVSAKADSLTNRAIRNAIREGAQ